MVGIVQFGTAQLYVSMIDASQVSTSTASEKVMMGMMIVVVVSRFSEMLGMHGTK